MSSPLLILIICALFFSVIVAKVFSFLLIFQQNWSSRLLETMWELIEGSLRVSLLNFHLVLGSATYPSQYCDLRPPATCPSLKVCHRDNCSFSNARNVEGKENGGGFRFLPWFCSFSWINFCNLLNALGQFPESYSGCFIQFYLSLILGKICQAPQPFWKSRHALLGLCNLVRKLYVELLSHSFLFLLWKWQLDVAWIFFFGERGIKFRGLTPAR
jgi:hypothetical protein